MKFYNRERELELLARTREVAFGNHSSEITSFVSLFETLMSIGRNLSFNLVVDEFQEFFYINPSIYSGVQDV